MFNIKITINGKPATKSNIKNEIKNMLFEAAINGVKEKIASLITEEESSKIVIDVVGDNIENLSFNIIGEEIIVNKIENALKQ